MLLTTNRLTNIEDDKLIIHQNNPVKPSINWVQAGYSNIIKIV